MKRVGFKSNQEQQDQTYMNVALELAEKAFSLGEVPVGAILVEENKIIAQAHNLVQQQKSALAHAELLALQEALAYKGEKYLPAATLYITLEPCPMCAMACSWTHIPRIVYAAPDPKRGYTSWHPSFFPSKIQVERMEGAQAQQSTHLLQTFFQSLRRQN